ncbi:MAG: winged helix-turn-helix domain-containing protein [Dehalococcoidia bacterium]
MADQWQQGMSGDELLVILSALANPHRLRIIASLLEGRNYVSQLARDIGMSRPLLHMHLRKLEAAGLIRGSLALSEDGKAMRFFDIAPFALHLTPELISEAAQTLTDSKTDSLGANEEEGKKRED